jgi:predicted acylesterase/phospholipase RssA
LVKKKIICFIYFKKIFFLIGVSKILADNNIFPKIVAGSSAGSIIAAFCGSLQQEKLLLCVNQDNQIDWSAFC